MKRLFENSSSGKRANLSFDVRLEDHSKYYFREDAVEGSVEISTPKQLKVTRLELVWSGRVRVQNPDGVKDEYELFSETSDLHLINENGDWRADAFRKTATVPSHGFLLPPAKVRAPPKTLEPNQTYSYPFRFYVPDHCVLPSCTEVSSLVSLRIFPISANAINAILYTVFTHAFVGCVVDPYFSLLDRNRLGRRHRIHSRSISASVGVGFPADCTHVCACSAAHGCYTLRPRRPSASPRFYQPVC